ncbi:hypothetical protein [Notoacmeibacter ruber]|uniref:Uncharacterized protein n=1 Tax=Notoacmeibacter ruber TaxID=2670375 RepID=A0A3L7JE11_9HYPH|nr:hypothetical protein [Notoacmeibacter ruber]RLQ88913.1 hypothetical protein D8780_12430 [Notoacmeibacter ruber]
MSLSELAAASPIETLRAAIIAELKPRLPGVEITSHPGKLDINDVVAKAVVAAPGVALGWSRFRSERLLDGRFDGVMEFAAYIVTEDYADMAAQRRIPRDALAHGIGSRILELLADPDVSAWEQAGIDRPMADPAPALTPMFTSRSWDAGTAYYAVTWSQRLHGLGTSFFDRPGLSGRIDEDGNGVVALGEDRELPVELAAFLKDEEAGQ